MASQQRRLRWCQPDPDSNGHGDTNRNGHGHTDGNTFGYANS
jgi:hypothetical protein